MALRVPAARINDIVNEERGLTAHTALRLARYFGTTAEFWMNMQSAWELEEAEARLGSKFEREVLPGQLKYLHRRLHLRIALHLHFIALLDAHGLVEYLLLQPIRDPLALTRPFRNPRLNIALR